MNGHGEKMCKVYINILFRRINIFEILTVDINLHLAGKNIICNERNVHHLAQMFLAMKHSILLDLIQDV